MSGPKWQRQGVRARAAPADVAPSPAARLAAPLGQGPALQRLLRQARQQRLHHGLLISGARGGGKTTVTQWLTAALLCPSELDTDGPCGMCATCRRIAAGNHPDVHLLARAQDEHEADEQEKSLNVIKVDQVRQAQEDLLRFATAGGARVLVIDEAELMNEAAQNALLKTLEEPGEATWLLLQTTRPEALLPTVRSRVQQLSLLPLPEATLRAELSSRLPQRREVHERALRLCGGSLGRALTLCTEQMVQLHDLVLAMVGDIQGLRPVATARTVLDGCKGGRQARDRAHAFLLLLRAELGARLQELELHPDSAYAAAQSESWCRSMEHALAAQQDVHLLIPPEQALTACLMLLQCDA